MSFSVWGVGPRTCGDSDGLGSKEGNQDSSLDYGPMKSEARLAAARCRPQYPYGNSVWFNSFRTNFRFQFTVEAVGSISVQ